MRVKVSDEMATKVAELHGGGKSIRALAAEFGVPRSTIGSILNRQQPALVQTATEESPVEVGTTVPSMIAQQDASDFLNTINATVPAATDADPKNEVKRQQQLTQLTESLLGKPTVPTPINRKMRMPSKPANEEEFDKLLEGLLDGKAPKKPKEKRSEAPPPPQQQLPDASALLAPVPAPSKADLITQITLNVEAFEPLLKTIVQPDRATFLKSLYSKSEKDLVVILGVINKTRTLANASNQLRHTLYMTAQGAEAVTSRFMNMKTEGFAQALRTQDEEIRMILREIVMDKLDSLQKLQRPELRLAMLFSTTLLATDSANRIKDASRKQLEATVSADTQQKHSDL
jgi:hypothetical protein